VHPASGAFALALLAIAAPAAAIADPAFNVPAGRLSDALIAVAEQSGITIAVEDPGLGRIRSRALRGRMSVDAALTRLLAGTGYRHVYVAARAVRILRVAPVRPAPPRPPSPPPPAPLPEILAPDIIVTASKQGTALDRFAGTARVIALDGAEVGRFGVSGSDMLIRDLPTLASTNLGPGRNKLYIRGVADSSFNGPSQSIVGQYLGDVRLTFNAPDPDLRLYDVERVEVLEGPQGTLYGSGSLGGILRLVPRAPDPDRVSGSFAAGLLSTRHGAFGGDGAAVLNLPIVPGRLAIRAVGYGAIEGGYIDDPGQGRRDVNRTSVSGGRAGLSWDAGDGWRIEAGGVAQFLSGRDGQYATRDLAPLTRRTNLAQPFDNDYLLGHLTIRKRWRGAELVSATGIVRHSLGSRFDATGFPGTSGPQLFTEHVGITLLTNETRLSQPNARGEGWVIGWSLVHDVDRITRSLGPPAAPLPIAGVRNQVGEAALFGQYSLALGTRIVGTLGGRFSVARTSGGALDAPDEGAEPDRADLHFSPTAAISWRAGSGLLVYARVQQGYRAGGLAITSSDAGDVVRRYRSDKLTAVEGGVRVGRAGAAVHLDAALSYALWSNIQADLIDARGLPYTSNLGDGRLAGLEVSATWRASSALSFDAAAFVNESALTAPNPAFAAAQDGDLPNIAGAGARAAAHLRAALSTRVSLALDGAVRYAGHSRLGIGPPLDIVQGGYVEAQLGARLDFGRFALSLDIDNLTDARSNRFSYGNPFTVGDGLQTTPLRPRTVRLGLQADF
jgi:outer membrane receptor protein involved in Fe transport